MYYNCCLYRIDEDGIIKVADFGLSEDIYDQSYFRQLKDSSSAIKLPVKWMAIESLHDGLFSEKSDVVSTIDEIKWYIDIYILFSPYSGLMVYCAGKCSVLVEYLILV